MTQYLNAGLFSSSTTSAPFPSAVVYFGDQLDRFSNAFGDLGAIVREVR